MGGGGGPNNPLGSSSTILSHLNLQTQLINNNPQDLHSFSLKKEQQNFTTTSGLIRPELPPWLACNPAGSTQIDLSSSSSIFSTRLDQDFTQQTHQDNLTLLHGTTPNPNPSLGIGDGGGGGPSTLPPYQLPPSAHMSATALLQKAAQMGATISGGSGGTNKTTATASSPAMMMSRAHQAQLQSATADSGTATNTNNFGLNLASRDHPHQDGFGFGFGFGSKSSGGGSSTSATTPASFLLHDMTSTTTTSTAGFHDHQADAFGVILNSKKDGNSINLDALSRTTAIAATTVATAQLNKTDESGGGGGGNGEGLTRDFLGLRPLSHSEILSMAGLGNTINHQHNQPHKPW